MRICRIRGFWLAFTTLLCPVAVFLTPPPSSWAAGQAASVEPPPVRKVVLYKHGMGYIERQGKVTGDVALVLAFRAEQMKDLLTSFFAVDLNGGKITSIQYETRDPLSKQLQDIPINVPEEAALSKFLAQLKGARLTAKTADGTVAGRILGVEPVTDIINNQSVQRSFLLVLLTDAGPIRALNLSSVAEFSLVDETLQRDLNRLLDISLDSKCTNRRKLFLTAAGKGQREIKIGYLIEMPIWKCSYRVIFDEKKRDASPLFQGWALAENTTEDDWRNVDISFVAGNPLSYVMDLYSPFYLRRSQVPIPGLEHLDVIWGAMTEPTVAGGNDFAMPELRKEDEALVTSKHLNKKAKKMKVAEEAAVPGARGDREELGAAAKPMADLLASSVSSVAKGMEVGELFSYEGQEKVNILRGQAAMVPILSQTLKGRRLLYYKAAFSPKVANAYVLRNDTELTLEAGAVTFFEGDTSLGEGILAHTLPPGSQEVIPYALDAATDVMPQVRSDRQPYFKGKLVDGILTLTCVEALTNTWKVTNRGKKPATLWLDQPKNTAYRLSKPEKPLNEVENHYRFELSLKPGETSDFVVEETRDVRESVRLANCDLEQIRFYMSQRYLSPGAQTFLKDLSKIMAQYASLQRQINEWDQQVKRLREEESRLRSNVGSLNENRPKERELRAKWVDELAAASDQLADLRGKLDDAGAKLRQLEEDIAKKVREYSDKEE
ncbi:MAG: DUF4139 domain-containing protein [Candidatus Aureabacteria bacterium]|nr:DUF4139 domain-containing protein [Candidatus Auribacterota bacterium]